MKSKLSKQEILEKINYVFSKKSSCDEIKKIRKLAMSRKIKLGELKRKFCRKCNVLFDFNNSEIRIKKGFKNIRCKECGSIYKYKIK